MNGQGMGLWPKGANGGEALARPAESEKDRQDLEAYTANVTQLKKPGVTKRARDARRVLAFVF